MKITLERKDHYIEYEIKTLIKRLIILIILIIGIYYINNYFNIKEEQSKFENSLTNNSNDNYYDQLVIDKNSKGEFKSFDNLIKVEGSLQIIEKNNEKYLKFSNNFKITNRPSLTIFLSTTPLGKEKISISKLNGNIGTQEYKIPASINITIHKYLLIIDSESNKPYAYAELKN